MTQQSLYTSSIPVLQQHLKSLEAILQKAELHAKSQAYDATLLLDSRLFPNMFSLKRQVQIACDNAKGITARLAGITPPVHEDNEMTFSDLYARLRKVNEFLLSVKVDSIDGHEEREVEIKRKDGAFKTSALKYLNGYGLPNFYFHYSMAYAILRHSGVPLGKIDYLGVFDSAK